MRRITVWLTVLACAAASDALAQQPRKVEIIQLRTVEAPQQEDEGGDEDNKRRPGKRLRGVLQLQLGQGAQGQLALGRDWIGVAVEPIGGALQSHLGIKQGLVIQQVFAGAPAAEAKLQVHDILLKFNGQPVGSIADLVKAVEGAARKPADVELLRQGEKRTVQVTPVERPREEQLEIIEGLDGPAEELIEQLIKEVEAGDPDGRLLQRLRGIRGLPRIRVEVEEAEQVEQVERATERDDARAETAEDGPVRRRDLQRVMRELEQLRKEVERLKEQVE